MAEAICRNCTRPYSEHFQVKAMNTELTLCPTVTYEPMTPGQARGHAPTPLRDVPESER